MDSTPTPSEQSHLKSERRPPSVIGADQPRDDWDWDCQCARCGSSLSWKSCEVCGGEGITGPGELYDEDPLWYDQDDYEACHQCNGKSSWPICLSSEGWCKANPLEGRERIECSTPEWFSTHRRDLSARVKSKPGVRVPREAQSCSSDVTTKAGER